jgi:general secretion pathway protein A
MYRSTYGLRTDPFSLTPDPNALYMSVAHREALVGLGYAILAEKGFVLLTADAGMGKTSLVARVLQQLPPGKVKSNVIFNPTLTATEFLEMVLMNFGVDPVPASKPMRLMILRKILADTERQGAIALLIIDEAHKLSPEVLEEVRLLGNFERPGKKLLQIALVGQSELNEKLGRPELWQLKQRFAAWLHIPRLSNSDLAGYVRFRWINAGGSESPFSEQALIVIGKASEGVPRIINGLCENALLLAIAENSANVTERHVLQACKDLGIVRPEEPPAPARAVVPERAVAPEAVVVPAPEIVAGTLETNSQVQHATPERPTLHSLERYAARPSLFRRCAAVFGFAG